MRFWTTFAIAVSVGWSITAAALIMQETWDGGTPPASWPYKQAPAKCDAGWEGNVFNGWKPEVADYCGAPNGATGMGFSSWSRCGLVTSPVTGGSSHSFKAFHDQTQGAESCDISKDLPPPFKNHIFIQVYLWFDPDFTSINSPPSSFPEGMHLMFTNQACSGCGFRINLMTGVPYYNSSANQCRAGSQGVPANQPYLFFSFGDGARQWGQGNSGIHTFTNGDDGSKCYNLLRHTGQWLKVQFEFDQPNQTARIWVDDSLKYVGRDTITQTDFHWLMLSNYGPSDLGGATASTKTIYYGPIIVSDTFITTTARTLRAPANLRVSP